MISDVSFDQQPVAGSLQRLLGVYASSFVVSDAASVRAYSMLPSGRAFELLEDDHVSDLCSGDLVLVAIDGDLPIESVQQGVGRRPPPSSTNG